ncbi:MAG: T9SS type A sorting domain-containing protein, partial [Saprospiraceae bacterium]|nr:T9SS type A sorting domain-containing protein [Saprospiraceae bacterium]
KKVLLALMVSLSLNAAWAQVIDDFETTSCPTIGCGNGYINNGCLPNWATSHGTPHVFPGFFGNQGGFNSPRALRMVYGPMNQTQWGGEGAFRTLSFDPDKCYVMKLWVFPTISTTIDGIFRIRLANNLVEDLDLGICHEPVPNVAGPTQNLLEENLSNYAVNTWQQITLTFTPTEAFTQLWLYLAPTVVQSTEAVGGTIRVDEIEITEHLLPKAGFTYTANPMCASGMVSFENVSESATNYSWNFGDGGTSTAENPMHTYAPGTYTVTLTVSNECGVDVETQTVVVSTTAYTWVVPQTTTLSNAISNNWLPATSVNNASVQITGILTIDQAEYTFQDADVTMESGAGIAINSLRKLTINNSNFTGCLNMWRGIHVLADASLTIVNNSYIANAEFAVRTESKSLVTLQGSRFDRNLISLFHAGPLPFVLFPFFGNEITCSEPLLPAYPNQLTMPASQSYAGIFVNDQTPLVIGSEGEVLNTFSNLRNGMITNRSNLSVVNTKFRNILESEEYADFTGFGIYCAAENNRELVQEGFGSGASSQRSFLNCTQAIFAARSGAIISGNYIQNVEHGIRIENVANQKIEVANNRIRSVYSGVELIGNDAAQGLSVAENHIYIAQGQPSFFEGVGIDVMESGLAHPLRAITGNRIYLHANNTGIRLNNAESYFASLNHIYLKAGYGFEVGGTALSNINCNKVFGEGSGIGLSVSTSDQMSYYCNWLSHSKTGASFQGACLTTNIETNSFFPPFRSGLAYDGSIMINPQIHRGNLWYGAAGDYSVGAAVNAIETDNFLDIAAVRFEVNTTASPAYPPSVLLPNAPLIPTNVWFKPDEQGSLPSCPDPDNCGQLALLPEGDGNTRKDVASGEYANPAYEGAVAWQAQRQLYKQLDELPELLNESVEVTQFYAANEQSILGRLHGIQKGIRALNGLLPEKRESLHGVNDAIRVHVDEIRSIDALLAQAQGSAYATLLAERQGKLDTVAMLSQDAEDLSDLILAAQVAEADVLLASNAAIAASAVYETNEKTVNGIYLATLAKGISAFSMAQQSSLKTIAGQCPLSGGIGVYQARSLYALIERVYYDDEQSCAVAQQQMQAPQMQPSSNRNAHFKTYPNPNTGTFTFEYNLEHEAILLLCDLAGRVVYEQTLASGKNSTLFASGQLRAGMYVLKVFTEAASLHTEKIIIIR